MHPQGEMPQGLFCLLCTVDVCQMKNEYEIGDTESFINFLKILNIKDKKDIVGQIEGIVNNLEENRGRHGETLTIEVHLAPHFSACQRTISVGSEERHT